MSPVILACAGKTGNIGFNYVLNEEKTEYAVRSKVGYANGIAPEIPETHNGKPVTAIDDGGFRGALAFISITIPETVKKIGHEAFRNCEGLTIIMKSTVPPTQDKSFIGVVYYGTKAIIVPASAVETYKEAWPEFKNIIYSDANVSGSFLIVDGALVSYFGGDEEVIIPTSAVKVNSRAFYNNELIHKVKLADTTTELASNAFSGCKHLEEISVSASNVAFSSKDGILYNKTVTSVIFIPANLGGEITIPNGITQMGFQNTGYFVGRNITSIKFPQSGYTRLVGGFFRDCGNLSNVMLPSDLDYIGTAAFENCRKLKEIIIPASVTQIETDAFKGCSGLTIKCKATEAPVGFKTNWNSGFTIVWGA